EETNSTPVKPKFNLFKKPTHVEENVAVEEKVDAEENVEATTGMPIEDSAVAPAVSPVAGEKKKGVFGFGGFGKSSAAAVKSEGDAAVGSENVETEVAAPRGEETQEAAVKEEKEVVGGGAEKEKKRFPFKNPFHKTNEPSSPVAETHHEVAEESKVEGVEGDASTEAAAATREAHEEIAAATVESETKEETHVEPSKKRFSFKIPSFQRSAGSTSSAPVTTQEKNAVAETEPVVETEPVKETVVVAQEEVKENVVIAQEAVKEDQHATAAAEEKTTSPKAPLFAFKFPSFQKASGSTSQSKDVSAEEVKPEAEASTEPAASASETKPVEETTTSAAPPAATETVSSPNKIASAFASFFSKPAAATTPRNEEPESSESHETVAAPVAGEAETATSPPAPAPKKGFARALSIPKLFVSSKHAAPETAVEEQPAVEAKEASAGETEPAVVVEKKAEGPTHKFVSGVKGLFAKKPVSGASEVEAKGEEEVGEVKAVSTETRDVVEGAVEGKSGEAVVAGESVVKSETGAGELKADAVAKETGGDAGVVVGAAAAEEEGEKGVTAA
ncbi:hypothetical protein HDU98_005161, partial [Podochytrium sp. JEL0797]